MIRITNKNNVILVGVFTFLIFSCAITSTKPNNPYSGHNSELEKLSTKNPLLAVELRKLPELQDGISANEIIALKKLIELYNNTSTVFDSAFDQMYKVGKPNVRKFCSPLEALFWLMEDGKFDLAKESIMDYDLKWLLIYAWADKKHKRWSNYNSVVERLNNPRLIDYYQVWNFEYKLSGAKIRRKGRSWHLFKTRKGECRDYTAFSVRCLRKAGYEARAIRVASPSGLFASHIVCEYRDNNKLYIIDNSCLSERCGGGGGIQEKQKYTSQLPQVGVGYFND